MAEVSDTTSTEIIDFNDILKGMIASTSSSKSKEEAMNVLLIQHLNTIEKQMQSEESLKREIALIEDANSATKSDKIQEFFTVQ